MNSGSRLVAASMGTVEALKDQGFCRWNRSISASSKALAPAHPQSAANKLSNSSDTTTTTTTTHVIANGIDQSEESLRKVMYLSCWAPY